MTQPTAYRTPDQFLDAADSLYDQANKQVTAPAVTLLILSIELLLKWHIWPDFYGFRQERERAHKEVKQWIRELKKQDKGQNGHDLVKLAEKALNTAAFAKKAKGKEILKDLEKLALCINKIQTNPYDTRYPKETDIDPERYVPGELPELIPPDPTLSSEDFEKLLDVAHRLWQAEK